MEIERKKTHEHGMWVLERTCVFPHKAEESVLFSSNVMQLLGTLRCHSLPRLVTPASLWGPGRVQAKRREEAPPSPAFTPTAQVPRRGCLGLGVRETEQQSRWVEVRGHRVEETGTQKIQGTLFSSRVQKEAPS